MTTRVEVWNNNETELLVAYDTADGPGILRVSTAAGSSLNEIPAGIGLHLVKIVLHTDEVTVASEVEEDEQLKLEV